jgi:hypothetical protein
MLVLLVVSLCGVIVCRSSKSGDEAEQRAVKSVHGRKKESKQES